MARKLIYSDFVIKICVVLVLLVYAWSAYDSLHASSNPYQASRYQTVYVNPGDSLWSVAAKHVGAKEDIRALIAAIRQVNDLSNDVAIYPGQALKIPLKNPPAK
jgi:hypothetical protein